MANIDNELNKIKNAVYGKDVRGSIHDGIDKINKETESTTSKADGAVAQVDNIQSQVDNLVVDGDSSVEAAQARMDKDGEIYATLKDRLDTENNEVSSQLAETEQGLMSIETANAVDDINLINYLGNKQNIHPKVLGFPNGWNGYKYWMAYTPYPNGATEHENPCIAVSDDKFNWTVPDGLVNPLAYPPEDGWYNSDTHLLYREDIDTLEIWWREVWGTNDRRIVRRTSTDGINWTAREQIFQTTSSREEMLSPSIIFEDGKYKVWSVPSTPGRGIEYRESVGDTVTAWTDKVFLDIDWGEGENQIVPWHPDVIKTDLGTEIITTCYKYIGGSNNTADLYYILIDNNGNISKPKRILAKSGDSTAIDDIGIYRSSILKEDGRYYVFYSSIASGGSRHMSLSYGDSVLGLTGYKNLDLIKKRGNRSVTIGEKVTLSDFDVTHIDTIELSQGADVVFESLKGGYLGKEVTILITSSTAKAIIENSSRIITPNGIDIVLSSTTSYAFKLICSSLGGSVFRPIYQKPLPQDGVLVFDPSSDRVVEELNVDNVHTIVFGGSSGDPFIVKSFAGGYVGQKIDIVVNHRRSVLFENSGRIRLPKRQDYTLTEDQLGVRAMRMAGSIWVVFGIGDLS